MIMLKKSMFWQWETPEPRSFLRNTLVCVQTSSGLSWCSDNRLPQDAAKWQHTWPFRTQPGASMFHFRGKCWGSSRSKWRFKRAMKANRKEWEELWIRESEEWKTGTSRWRTGRISCTLLTVHMNLPVPAKPSTSEVSAIPRFSVPTPPLVKIHIYFHSSLSFPSCKSTTPLSYVIRLSYILLTLFLPRWPLSLIFAIFNIQPTFTFLYDIHKDQFLLHTAPRGVPRRKKSQAMAVIEKNRLV